MSGGLILQGEGTLYYKRLCVIYRTVMKKKLIRVLAVALGLVGLVVIICNLLVYLNGEGKIYDTVETMPHNRYGLLLGTSPITRWGTHNYYFDRRIEAADKLYKAGKIDSLIVSGGNYVATEEYGCDEPAAMRDSLIARGVPSEKIILDYDGERTIKSFQNAKNLFHLDSLTVISQAYHNSRALYIAKHYDIEAVAINATEPDSGHKLRNHIREYMARVKLFIDLIRD